MIVLGGKRLTVSLCCDMGQARKSNQDNYFVNGAFLTEPEKKRTELCFESDGGLFAVADGMGGEANGDKASLTAVQELAGEYSKGHPRGDDICRAVLSANERVCEMVRSTGSRSGTTLAAALINGNKLSIYNIGDSKCLLYRNGTLTQLSRDHTVTAQLIEAGLMTKQEAARDRRSHQLFQHIGIESGEMQLSVFRNEGISMQPDDVLIICSDGLTDGLSAEDMISLISSSPDRNTLAGVLVDAAISKGSMDNVTALTVSKGHKTGSALKALLVLLGCLGAAAVGTLAYLFASGIIRLY